MSERLISATVEKGEVVIRVKLKDLVFIIENDPEYKYKVHDKKRLGEMMCFALENSESHCNDDGMNGIEELFQRAYESVYEEGEDSVITGKSHFDN